MLQGRLALWDELFVKRQEELEMATTRATEFQGTKNARNTLKAYMSDWRDFEKWCADMGKVPLPADPDTVVLYLSSLAPVRKCSTLERRVSAITHKHKWAALPSPNTQAVHSFLAGARRKSTARVRRKAAITTDELSRVCNYLRKKGGARAIRDRAAILLGFSAAFRRSDVVCPDLEDISLGPDRVAISLWRSKTDQEGKGREMVIPRAKRAGLCVVRALAAWLEVRGDWQGPLFCEITRWGEEIEGNRMSADTLYHALRTAAMNAGMDYRKFGSHSLRAGAATAAADDGADVFQIMALTGHKSANMAAQYVRRSVVRYPLRNVL